MNFKKLGISLFIMCSVLIVGGNVNKAYAGYTRDIDNLVVNLKVRSGPSINARHIITLAADKDVVGPTDASSQKWVTEGGVSRLWSSYAYPLLSNGKYTNQTRGWMCTREKNDLYVVSTGGAAIDSSAGGYLYKDSSLSSKYSTKYSKGTTFGSGEYTFKHSPSNLNAWEVRPGGTLKYMDGWLSNAFNR